MAFPIVFKCISALEADPVDETCAEVSTMMVMVTTRLDPALEARIRSYHMHDSFRECIRISEYDIMLRHSFTGLTDFMHECQHV